VSVGSYAVLGPFFHRTAERLFCTSVRMPPPAVTLKKMLPLKSSEGTFFTKNRPNKIIRIEKQEELINAVKMCKTLRIKILFLVKI
jgi:hypothetical protein